ncbi:DUF6702 family protein [Mucilaginibacter antarcticus]|uniref:DUF6702 family protein n=1 Tax=Mucilaginibacter antarcticus TaxID=1855725 RepID=A0ABW5XR16_9SPHI
MALLFYRWGISLYFLTGWFPSPKTTVPHPLHVSNTDICYNAAESKLEVICGIFTDDLEAALVKQYHTKTDLVKPEMHEAMDALVKRYLAANVHIKTGNTPLTFYYVGYELEKGRVNAYFESEKTPAPKKIEAEVSLLHNLYTDQSNIVHITVNGTRKSEKLDYPDKRVVQSF